MALYFGEKTKIAVRTEDFSDKNLDSYRAMNQLKADYNFEDKLTIVVSKGSKFNQNDFCNIYQWLQKEVNQNNLILGTSSLYNLRSIQYEENRLFYPLVLSDPCIKSSDLEVLSTHPLIQLFSTSDLNDMLINFNIRTTPEGFRHGVYDYEEIEKIISRAKKQLPYEVIPGGTLFFQASVFNGIKATQTMNLIASFLLFCAYYFFYRSIIGAVALLLVIFTIHTFIKAGMGVFDHMIDPLSSCIFLMLTVSALEDYILLSLLVFKQKIPFNSAIKKLLLPSFLTSLTTAIGFGSLSVSSNPSIVHFSIWTALGAMFEWFAIFIIAPVFYNQFKWIKKKIDHHPKPLSMVSAKITSFTPNKKITLILALTPLLVLFIYDKANLNYSPFDMFDNHHPISTFREHFKKTRKSEGEISVVFNDQTTATNEIIEKMKLDPAVTHIFSDLEISNEFEKYPTHLRSLLWEDFKRTDTGKLFYSSSTKRILLAIKSYDTKDIPDLVNRLNAICKNQCNVQSEIIVSKDYALGILQTLYDSAISGFILIVALVIFLVYAFNKNHILPILLSTLWASFMLLIFVIVFQFKINVVTCVALSVLIGLAGDNAIQFLLLQKKSFKKSITDIGEASTENFIMMILLSSTLFFSYFKTPKILGLLMIMGIFFMLVGDVWILNGLISNKKSEKKYDDQVI